MLEKNLISFIYDTKIRVSTLLSFVLLLLFVNIYPINGIAGTTPIVEQEVEKAILNEDWENIADNLLGSVDVQTQSSVLRLIKAHACLALNRNNESLCLFLSTSTEGDLRIWDDWTQGLVQKNPGSSMTHYLRGDALARLTLWEQALFAFDKALKLDANHALTLNGRGVIQAVNGKLASARWDFERAIKVKPEFADPYANLGARLIQMKDGAEGAIKIFGKALELYPSFSIALHGRGCLRSLFEPASAKIDIENSMIHGSCAANVFMDNLFRIQAFMQGMEQKEMLASLTDENPGTSLSLKYKSYDRASGAWNKYVQNPNQRNYNRFCNSANQLSPSQVDSLWKNKMAPSLQSNSQLFAKTDRFNNTVSSWNRNGAKNVTTGIHIGLKTAGTLGAAAAAGAGHPYSSVGIKVGTDFTAYTIKNGLDKWTNNNLNFSNRIDTKIGSHRFSHKVGGVRASFADTTPDYGDWPFNALYGLMYFLDSNTDLSAIKEN